MKKLLLIFLVTLSIKSKAQPHLWGTMQIGGTGGVGVIYHINGDGTGYTAAPGFTGSSPQSNLLPYNGFLYGMTNSGGVNSLGDIYKYNATTGVYTTLFSFTAADGKYPGGTIFLASNGKMYGTAMNGGSSDLGTFFSFDPSNNQFTKLVDFIGMNGSYPMEDVIEYNGKLYGTTGSGGLSSFGSLFSYDLSSGNFTTVHNFIFTDGMAPYGSLLQWNSLLYGTAFVGGATGAGSIFSFDPLNPGTVTTVHNFNTTNGSAPMGSLIYAGNSIMYGVTAQGGTSDKGVIFSFNPSGNIYTKLHDFNTVNGEDPEGSLIQASDGNLYGATVTGGTGNVGTLFKYDIGNSQFTKIYNCTTATGSLPRGNLLEYNAVTGLYDLSKNNELKIRSNPVKDYLSIVLNGYNDVFQITVFSIDGKVINTLNNVLIDDEYSIEVNDLAVGNYFINVSSEKHEFISQFVKQ